MTGGVVEEATREGEVFESHLDFYRRFPRIKIFFFSYFKSRFHIFYKKISTGGWHNWTAYTNGFLQAVPDYLLVEKIYFHRHTAQTVYQSACGKRLGTAYVVVLCTSVEVATGYVFNLSEGKTTTIFFSHNKSTNNTFNHDFWANAPDALTDLIQSYIPHCSIF